MAPVNDFIMGAAKKTKASNASAGGLTLPRIAEAVRVEGVAVNMTDTCRATNADVMPWTKMGTILVGDCLFNQPRLLLERLHIITNDTLAQWRSRGIGRASEKYDT